jgi:hypothetical protein
MKTLPPGGAVMHINEDATAGTVAEIKYGIKTHLSEVANA